MFPTTSISRKSCCHGNKKNHHLATVQLPFFMRTFPLPQQMSTSQSQPVRQYWGTLFPGDVHTPPVPAWCAAEERGGMDQVPQHRQCGSTGALHALPRREQAVILLQGQLLGIHLLGRPPDGGTGPSSSPGVQPVSLSPA